MLIVQVPLEEVHVLSSQLLKHIGQKELCTNTPQYLFLI